MSNIYIYYIYIMDFPSLLTAQSDYVSTATANATNLGNVKTQLTALKDVMTNDSMNAIYTRQQEMDAIVNGENARLRTKGSSIDQAKQGQDRLIALNQNYSKRFSQYIQIIVIWAFVFVIFLAISMGNRNFGFLPAGAMEVITIILIGGALIYSISVYTTILQRSNMNYDEISIPPPRTALTAAEIAKQTADNQASGNLLGQLDLGACIGSSCCASGTHWNTTTQQCASGELVSAFTTMSQAYIIKPFNSLATKPFEPSEFDSYAKI